MRIVSLIALCFGLFLAGLVPQSAAAAEASQKAIIVLDASGSMWGQVEGRSKIEIARDVIAEMLGSWDPNVALGITAYGHRRKGDCQDIETIVPVGPVDGQAISSRVNSLNPKGKTPLSDAVRQAAQALRFTEDRATVILLSDGKETCEADPCAVARELEAAGIDFTVHVVGFDLTAEEAGQLRCMADNTGGSFVEASNASELREAMTQTAQIVSEPEPAPAPAPEPEPAVDPGIKVTTLLAAGGTPIEKDLGYEVFEAKKDLQGKRKKVTYSYDASPFFQLEPGKYIVSVGHGSAIASAEVDLAAGERIDLELVLDAGYLKVASIPTAGAEALTKDVGYEVFGAKKDLEGNRKKVTYSYDATPLFRLNAGRYVIYSSHGQAGANAEVEIKPGELTEITLDLNVGYLRVTPVPTAGADPLTKDIGYEIFAAKKDLEGNRKKVTYSYDASPLFKLPAGAYLVVAKHGSAGARSEAAVEAGGLTEITMDLDVGYLRVTTLATADGAQATANIGYVVFEAKKDLSGKRKKVTYSYDAVPLFRLNAGRYLVTSHQGEMEAAREIEITAGSLEEVELVLQE